MKIEWWNILHNWYYAALLVKVKNNISFSIYKYADNQ